MSNISGNNPEDRKKDSKAAIKGFIVIGIIVFLCYLAFNDNGSANKNKSNDAQTSVDSSHNEDKATNANTSKVDSDYSDVAHDSLKSNFNGDNLKDIFSKDPFNYEFKYKETTIQGTTDTWVEGQQAENEYPRDVLDLPNSIIIEYDLNSRKANKITLYLNHIPANIKLKDLKKLFEFTNYFDHGPEKYIKKNFKNIFYNEDEFDKLAPYENKDKNFKMGIDNELLFTTRKLIKRDGLKDKTGNAIMNVEIDFL